MMGKATYPLKHLLPPNILQTPIQILNPLDDILDLALIRTLNLGRLSDCQVECQSYAAEGCEAGEPAAMDGD